MKDLCGTAMKDGPRVMLRLHEGFVRKKFYLYPT